MRLKGTSAFNQIQLAGKDKTSVPNEIQVLRVGDFNHPDYGKFSITPRTLSEMVKNFENNIRGIDLSFDYYHDSGKDASAWVGKLELRAQGSELWATGVEWTPAAVKKLSDRELRYFSPDFAFVWKDPESGATFSNVLFGGGLTNRPFVKEMKAIVAAEGENTMTELEKAQAKIAEMEATNKKLSEDVEAAKKLAYIPGVAPAAHPAMPPAAIPGQPAPGVTAAGPDEVAMLKKQCADLTAQLAEAQKQIAAATAAKQMADREASFGILLTEGKACAAQKEAFLKGDMAEFVKLAQPINLKGFGKISSTSSVDGDEEDKILALAETKMKADAKLSKGDAIKLARKEIKN